MKKNMLSMPISHLTHLYIVLTILLCLPVYAETRYVSPSGENVYPYTSWVDAANCIQDAVDAAHSGDTILVTNGVYNQGQRLIPSTTALPSRLALSNSVFVSSVNGPDVTIIDADNTTNGECRGVYLSRAAELSGFTITNGHALSSGSVFDQCGAGILIEGPCVVSNCVISGNFGHSSNSAYGGGVFCAASNSMVTHSRISGNQAVHGGGIYGGIARNCIVDNNTALNGGGAAQTMLNNCLVVGNQATDTCGGAENCFVYNCTIVDNTKGGLYESSAYNSIMYDNDTYNWQGDASLFHYCCTKPIPNSFFDDFEDGDLYGWTIGGRRQGNNIADIVSRNGTMQAHLRQSKFTEIRLDQTFSYYPDIHFTFDFECDVDSGGAGIHSAFFAMSRVVFEYYDADSNNLASISYGKRTSDYALTNTAKSVFNFVTNQGPSVIDLSTIELENQVVITNNIAYVKIVFEAYTSGWSYDMTGELWVDNISIGNGQHNISGSPEFIDAQDGDYRIKSTSPCIDAGNMLFVKDQPIDLLGNPRMSGNEVDIGAYEYQDIWSVMPSDSWVLDMMKGDTSFTSSRVYQVSNTSGVEMPWTIQAPNMFECTPASGVIQPNETIQVTVRVTNAAADLPGGQHVETLVFDNTISHYQELREVMCNVFVSPKIAVFPDSISVTNITGGMTTAWLSISNLASASDDLDIRLSSRAVNESSINTVFTTEQMLEKKNAELMKGVDYVPNQLLVRMAAPMSRLNATDVLSSLGARDIIKTYELVSDLYLIELPVGTDIRNALTTFNESSDILYAEPDYVLQVDDIIPNDARFDDLWGLYNTGQDGGTEGADIGAIEAWSESTGSRDIVVAVIDTGVDYNHQDLRDNMWVNTGEIAGNNIDDDGNGFVDDVYGYDFCNNDGDPYDDRYHGTHCAGTIGAIGNNAIGVAGVCWQIKIMAVKFISSAGSGSTSDAIESVEYATKMKARIMSNSWGGGGYNQSLKDAIDAAGEKGILFIASAGNDGNNNDISPHYPSNYESDNIIAVLATDRNDNMSSFSCYGATSVDIGAPGSEILSCSPDNTYRTLSGTSMAAPHISGACALMLSLNPDMSASECKEVLLSTVDSTVAGKCVSEGRVNLARALSQIKLKWLDIDPIEIQGIEPGTEERIALTFSANTLPPDRYQGKVVISCNDIHTPEIIIPIEMTVLDDALNILPDKSVSFSGIQGGPFTPSNMLYTLVNDGSVPLTWQLDITNDWISADATNGTIEPGDETNLLISLDMVTHSLEPGEYISALSFINMNTMAKQHRILRLSVQSIPGELDVFDSIMPDNDLTMPFGNMLTEKEISGYMTLTNSDATHGIIVTGLTVNVYRDDSDDGMILSSTSLNMIAPGLSASGPFYVNNVPAIPFTIAPESSVVIPVTYAPVVAGSNSAEVIIMSNDEDESTITVELTGVAVNHYLILEGDDEFSSEGHPGGPFTPDHTVYTLTNTGTNTLSWIGMASNNWLTYMPASGELPFGHTVAVTVSVTQAAAQLPGGCYTDVLTFSNQTSGKIHTRPATLHVLTTSSITVSPTSMTVFVAAGSINQQTLQIGNVGDADLTYTLSYQDVTEPETLVMPETIRSLASADDDKILMQYTFEKPVHTTDGIFDVLRITDAEQFNQPGAPMIPVYPVRLLIPCGKDVDDIQVEILESEPLSGVYDLQPAQEPQRLSQLQRGSVTERDTTIYSMSTAWPESVYTMIGEQSKRGYRMMLLNLFPLQYVPTTGKIIYNQTIQVKVTLTDRKREGIIQPDATTQRILSKRVQNQEALTTYLQTPTQLNRNHSTINDLSGGPFDYIIITPEAFQNAPEPYNFEQLRDRRIAEGYRSVIVTTEWIYNNYSGTRPDGGSDNQTKIRNFLIEAYQNWGATYVLLGGAEDYVPARNFYVSYTYMPVDMYYGCVEPAECTFDYDADGKYGERYDGVNGNDVDLYAELYVGRAPVEDTEDIANFVRKTLAYDTSSEDYLNTIMMVGEHLRFGGVAEYAKNAMEQIRLGGEYDEYYTFGFEHHNYPDYRDFNTSHTLYDADATWHKSELIEYMNQGVHIINHLGHASTQYDMKLYNSNLSSLTNTSYFFAYSQGCNPGRFDSNDCFAEEITTHTHGAFAVIMNARYGYGRRESTDGPSQRFARQFWDAALGEEMLELGRMNQDSKEDNLWDINGSHIRWCYYELTLFGDPVQKLRFSDKCNWLEVEPHNGIINPHTTSNAFVTLNTVGLSKRAYHAHISLNSNDKEHPNILIPVTMHVTDPNPNLMLSMADSLTEGDGVVTNIAYVTIPDIATNNVSVRLTSDDQTEITVPESIVIPEGETSAMFMVTVMDDDILDGSRMVSITAEAEGYTGHTASLLVHDNEVTSLFIDIPTNTFIEGSGIASVPATIYLTNTVDEDITVSLSSSDNSEISFPSNLIIEAGASSANVLMTIHDDHEIDGDQRVRLSASVTNWLQAVTTVTVIDNEDRNLRLYIANTNQIFYEGTETISNYYVALSGTYCSNVTVSLQSDDTTEFVTAPIVIIPAGQTSVCFSAETVDDNEQDGDQAVHVTAVADGFETAQSSITIVDDEWHHFDFENMALTYSRGEKSVFTIAARNIDNQPLYLYQDVLIVSASGENGCVTTEPDTEWAITNMGQRTIELSFLDTDSNVVLMVCDQQGHCSQSESFNISGPIMTIQPDNLSGQTLYAGTTKTIPIEICNNGNEALSVTCAEQTSTGVAFIEQPVIATFSNRLFSLYAVNIDNNHTKDIVAATTYIKGDLLSWMNLDGEGHEWDANVIATALPGTTEVKPGDFDRDGDTDLIALDQGVCIWENIGVSSNQWLKQNISNDSSENYLPFINVADIDNDGDLDVVDGSGFPQWFENQTINHLDFRQHYIYNNLIYYKPHFSDVNKDGYPDMIGQNMANGALYWQENPVGINASNVWLDHSISPDSDLFWSVSSADFDSDGDNDVLASDHINNRILIFENKDNAKSWEQHVVASFEGSYYAISEDIDMDGDIDIVATSDDPGTVAWWENNTNGFAGWQQHIVAENVPGAHAVATGDIDNDGLPDILAAIDESKTLQWWKNVVAETNSSWVSVSQETVTIAPGSCETINVTLSAEAFATNTYVEDVLQFRSNDALNPTSMIPVSMHVLDNLADLMIDSISVTNQITLGSALTIEYVVANHGTRTAGDSFTGFYLSNDDILDTNDFLFEYLDYTPSLNAGAIYTNIVTLTTPAIGDWLDGDAYLLVEADYTYAVDEAVENNNIGTSDTITLTPSGDINLYVTFAEPMPFIATCQSVEFQAWAEYDNGFLRDITTEVQWFSDNPTTLEFMSSSSEALAGQAGNANVVAGDSVDLFSRRNLGECLFAAGEYDSAAVHLRLFVRDNPGPEGFTLYARALLAAGDTSGAKINFERAVARKDSAGEEAVLILAALLAHEGRADSAANLIGRLSGRPGSAEMLFETGNRFLRMRETGLSIFFWKQAVELDSAFTPAYRNLASAYVYLKRHAGARTVWKKLLRYEPGAADIYLFVARSYAEAGKPDSARIFAENGLKTAKNDAERMKFKPFLNTGIRR